MWKTVKYALGLRKILFGSMVQSVKCLLYEHMDLSSDTQERCKTQVQWFMVYIYNTDLWGTGGIDRSLDLIGYPIQMILWISTSNDRCYPRKLRRYSVFISGFWCTCAPAYTHTQRERGESRRRKGRYKGERQRKKDGRQVGKIAQPVFFFLIFISENMPALIILRKSILHLFTGFPEDKFVRGIY